jgi:hypothetical protein
MVNRRVCTDIYERALRSVLNTDEKFRDQLIQTEGLITYVSKNPLFGVWEGVGDNMAGQILERLRNEYRAKTREEMVESRAAARKQAHELIYTVAFRLRNLFVNGENDLQEFVGMSYEDIAKKLGVVDVIDLGKKYSVENLDLIRSNPTILAAVIRSADWKNYNDSVEKKNRVELYRAYFYKVLDNKYPEVVGDERGAIFDREWSKMTEDQRYSLIQRVADLHQLGKIAIEARQMPTIQEADVAIDLSKYSVTTEDRIPEWNDDFSNVNTIDSYYNPLHPSYSHPNGVMWGDYKYATIRHIMLLEYYLEVMPVSEVFNTVNEILVNTPEPDEVETRLNGLQKASVRQIVFDSLSKTYSNLLARDHSLGQDLIETGNVTLKNPFDFEDFGLGYDCLEAFFTEFRDIQKKYQFTAENVKKYTEKFKKSPVILNWCSERIVDINKMLKQLERVFDRDTAVDKVMQLVGICIPDNLTITADVLNQIENMIYDSGVRNLPERLTDKITVYVAFLLQAMMKRIAEEKCKNDRDVSQLIDKLRNKFIYSAGKWSCKPSIVDSDPLFNCLFSAFRNVLLKVGVFSKRGVDCAIEILKPAITRYSGGVSDSIPENINKDAFSQGLGADIDFDYSLGKLVDMYKYIISAERAERTKYINRIYFFASQDYSLDARFEEVDVMPNYRIVENEQEQKLFDSGDRLPPVQPAPFAGWKKRRLADIKTRRVSAKPFEPEQIMVPAISDSEDEELREPVDVDVLAADIEAGILENADYDDRVGSDSEQEMGDYGSEPEADEE